MYSCIVFVLVWKGLQNRLLQSHCLKFRIEVNAFYYFLDFLSSVLSYNARVTLNFHVPYIHMTSKTNEKLFVHRIVLHLVSLFLGKTQAPREQPQWNETEENQRVLGRQAPCLCDHTQLSKERVWDGKFSKKMFLGMKDEVTGVSGTCYSFFAVLIKSGKSQQK